MSSIGICEYCKYIDKDITEKPCLHCSANMGAFEFDLSEHDAKVRADERSHIVEILFGIDRQVAELVKEILNREQK